MKNSIKKAAAAVVLLLLILVFSGFSGGVNLNTFDVSEILKTIEILSSKEFNGRMAGTIYGTKTEEYVASRFKKIGLKPAGENNTYFQQIHGVSGNPAGEYVLEVLDGQKVIKTYKYGSDYKFFTSYSFSGDATGRAVPINIKDGTVPEVSDGEIALLDSTQIDSNFSLKTISNVYEAGYRGLIVTRNSAISRVKGQGGIMDSSPASKLPRVLVDKKVFDEIKKFSQDGYRIHLKAAFEVKNYTARNVIGILKSNSPSDEYLIISAHMDHLGPDPDGAYYPGALDNASGTASIIEIARVLANQPRKPDINIVFIAFSGEEVSLDGSKHYVKNPIFPLKKTKVINLDMVGAKSDLPISIVTSGEAARGKSNLIDQFVETAKELNYPYEISNSGASDHSPFAMAGVPAVTLIDFEKVIYHVPEDTIDNIGVNNLKRAVGLTMRIIEEEAYSDTDVVAVAHASINIWIYTAGGVLVSSVLLLIAIRFVETKKQSS